MQSKPLHVSPNLNLLLLQPHPAIMHAVVVLHTLCSVGDNAYCCWVAAHGTLQKLKLFHDSCDVPSKHAGRVIHRAPACCSIGTSLPCLCSVMIPGPSLQPPTLLPLMKMLGTLVRSVNCKHQDKHTLSWGQGASSCEGTKLTASTLASSALMAFPSSMVSNSTAVYLAPRSDSNALAFLQKGQPVQLNTTTCGTCGVCVNWRPVGTCLAV